MEKATDRSRTKHLFEHLMGAVSDALSIRGFDVTQLTQQPEIDLVASTADKDLLIEITVVRDAVRKTDIEDKLGATAIQLLQKAGQWRTLNGRAATAIILVGLPEISEKAWAFAERFAESWVLPLGETLGIPCAVGLVDSTGAYRLSSDILPGLNIRPQTGILAGPKKTNAEIDLFSELNQWQLKILLGIRLPPKWIHLPDRNLRIRTPADLATKADVSRALSYKLVKALKADFYLDEGTYLSLTREEELLRQWAPYGSKYGHTMEAVPVFPKPIDLDMLGVLIRRVETHQQEIGEDGRPNRIALAGTAAAHYLGLGHVSGAVPVVYCEVVTEDLLKVMGLRQAKVGETPQVIFRRPKYPESVFRAAVHVHDVPVTDIVQTWMDVQHAARGNEQAAVIFAAIHRCLEMKMAFGPGPTENDWVTDDVQPNS